MLYRSGTLSKWLLLAIGLFCLCLLLVSVDASFKAHKKFAKHLYKFVKKEKQFFKKKGLEAAALLALGSMSKKKVFPIPLPLPIPIVHQPIIHEPVFLGKFAAKGFEKGLALDLLGSAKTGGLGGIGGIGGIGGLGGLGGLGFGGGLGGLGGII